MLSDLIGNIIIKLTGGIPAESAGENLDKALSLILPEVEAHSIFIKTESGELVLYIDSNKNNLLSNAKGLCVTYNKSGVNPWETEIPAKYMHEKLSKILKSEPFLQFNRDNNSFAGWYVYIKNV